MEQRHVEILTTVKAVVSVPVAVKLSPYFSSTGEMALRLDQAGADGLVLFNRFLQPDIDPETLTVTAWHGLSTQAEGRLPRAWIALLAGRVRASLAATTGVEDAADVAKYLLAGADVVMTASALLRHGPGYAGVLVDELSGWMARKGFRTVGEVRGLLSVPAWADEAATSARATSPRSRPPTATTALGNRGQPADRQRRRCARACRARRPGRTHGTCRRNPGALGGATQLGLAAHAYVRENYVGDIHLMRYARLLGTLRFEDLSPRYRPPGTRTAGTAEQGRSARWLRLARAEGPPRRRPLTLSTGRRARRS